jgi:hypothetical protein
MVNKLFVILFFGMFISAIQINAQEPALFTKLKQIVPLHSTETDVERLYGKPIEQYSEVKEYKTEEGILTVTYADGKCSSNRADDYDVETGNVIEVGLRLDSSVKLKSLALNIREFEEIPDNDSEAVGYKSVELGLKLSTFHGKVGAIRLFPPEKYSHLICKTPPQSTVYKNPVEDKINEWLTKLEQLKLLHSNREQVRHLFGKPRNNEFIDAHTDSFPDDLVSIAFVYSTGTCSLKNLDLWNVPEGTVFAVNIFLQDGIEPKIFGPDIANSIKGTKFQTFFKIYEDYKVEFRAEKGKIRGALFMPLENNTKLLCGK